MSRTTAAELRGVFGRLLRNLESHGVDITGYRLDNASVYGGWTVAQREERTGGESRPFGDKRVPAGQMWDRLDYACRALEMATNARR